MMLAVGTAIVTASFPDQERGKALGILGLAISTGLVSGPVIGGFLLDVLDWRSIFYIRIPVGIGGLVIAWLLLREQKILESRLRLDLFGTGTLFVSLCSLLVFFNLGGKLGWVSPPVLILAGSTVAFLALFLVVEARGADPVVDLRLFKNRTFASGNISLGILLVATSPYYMVMPFYLIGGLGYSASKAGLLLPVASLTVIATGPPSGWLSDKVGTRPLCTVGMAIISFALFLLSRLGMESSEADILIRLVVLGIGLGLFQSPNRSAIMGAAPRGRLGTASALIATVTQLGMASGIALAAAIFTSRQLFYSAQLARESFAPAILQKAALVGGYQDAFLVAAIICSIGIFTSLVREGRRPEY
jgi:EmrB/QacA subfamily drug resistance transporter